MEILLKAHSGFRWLVLLAAVISAVIFLINWLRQAQDSPLDRKLMSIFVGLMDLQTLMGLVLLLWDGFTGGGFPRHRLEHLVTMLIAVVLAHMSAKWKNAPAALRARNYFITIVVVFLFIFLGIQRLPQGWTMG